MSNARYAVLIGLSVSLVGCGTINTVVRGDEVTRRDLQKRNTYCDSIPRVYSGVAYDLCILHGPSKTITQDLVTPVLLPLRLLDLIPSAVLDTLVLPYTIYRQSTDDSIDLAQ
ncbi:YceK/YidQ family lipoprotein [Pseudomonas deceptionensis]|uniref:Uncharacterized conserved protein YceK n=1 Tax=Pseudomonas deceptionensis TaxID=882211 RepID=A0A1H5HUW4_PSEDM|nr:YceK/YidQ family lipoprotein [Pseudomonas deceptionensis]SEE31793.1 Uncharacterized conserved protein YceK [Pseudomonas deceptionensis]